MHAEAIRPYRADYLPTAIELESVGGAARFRSGQELTGNIVGITRFPTDCVDNVHQAAGPIILPRCGSA